jgi:hypothetical protein
MYEYERYVATNETIMEVIDKYGVAIIPSVLDKQECDQMNIGMWNNLEHLSQKWLKPINREDPNTWREMRNLYPSHSMLIQNWSIGHSQYIWDIRQNPKIVDIFSKIWKCEKDELLVSFDGVSYGMPPEVTKLGWYKGRNWLHSDQSYLDSSFKCIQGWVTGNDVDDGDSTLTILESSNDYHKDFQDKFKTTEKNNWYKLNEEDELKFYEDKYCLEKRIKCPMGSVVLWDSRTIHCGSEPLKTREKMNFRNIAYLCYMPKKMCSEKNVQKKIKAFEEMRMTTHWPCNAKLFPKNPQTYGGPIQDMAQIPTPILNELGRKLVGY